MRGRGSLDGVLIAPRLGGFLRLERANENPEPLTACRLTRTLLEEPIQVASHAQAEIAPFTRAIATAALIDSSPSGATPARRSTHSRATRRAPKPAVPGTLVAPQSALIMRTPSTTRPDAALDHRSDST